MTNFTSQVSFPVVSSYTVKSGQVHEIIQLSNVWFFYFKLFFFLLYLYMELDKFQGNLFG